MADAAPDTPVAVVAVVKAHEPPSLDTRKSWIEDWMTATAAARASQQRNERYYYGHQRTNEELEIFRKRKQPPSVDNLIRRKVNSVRGEEIDKRVDPVAKPRTPKHEEEAKAATDALRYVEEDQKIDEIGGDIMLDLLITGVGGAIVEVDDQEEYRCLVQHIPWNEIAVDPRSRRRDTEDAKWKAHIKWFDLDDAQEMYEDAADALAKGCDTHIGGDDDATEDRPNKWFDSKRKRVKIVMMYYQAAGVWYRCDFTSGVDLRPCAPSVYLDPRSKQPKPWCPMIVGRCYVDQDNNAQGPVDDMISPQDGVNKRKSKLLHEMHTRAVIAKQGAVEDPHKFQSELAKADGFAEFQDGFEFGTDIVILPKAEITAAQFQMLQEDKQSIDTIGPAAATLPDLPQGASGRSFAFRQKAAAREMGPLFEVFGSIRLSIYWHAWGCIKQFQTDEMWLRVTDDEETAGYRWVGLNRRMTRAERLQELLEKGQQLPTALQNAAGEAAQDVLSRVQQMHQAMAQQAIAFGQPPPGGPEHMVQMVLQDPVMQEQIIENQVAEAMVDITIHEAPESAVLADEEFAKLSEFAAMAAQLRPDMTSFFAELLVELSAFRDKRKMLQKMREPANPQQQQQQAMQQQMAMQGAQAGIAVQKTQAQLNAARAMSEQAKAKMAGAKVPSEIEKNQAQAMRDAAAAGETMGGGMLPGVM